MSHPGSPWQEIGDGVFRRRYPSLDLNIGLVVGAGAALVVDTRATYGQADELRAEISAVTEAPVAYVVNTHHHWDHTFGNARFPESELVGHALCAHELVARGPAMKEQLQGMVAPSDHAKIDAIEIAPPTTTFDNHLTLEVGGRSVTLRYCGRAHTNNDIVIAAEDVVFAGDILEESAPPYFGDSYPLEWAVTASEAIGTGDLFVPGHGDVMTRARSATQVEELGAVESKVRASLASGDPITEGPYPLEVMQAAWERSRAIE